MTALGLTVHHHTREDYEIVETRGELDLTTVGVLEDSLGRAARKVVVLDLGLLAFVDSAGIRAIDLAHRHLRDGGGRLLLVAPPGSRAAWTFRVAGFDAPFHSLDAALDALAKSTSR